MDKITTSLSEKMKECPWYGSTLDIMLPIAGDHSNEKWLKLYPASSCAWAVRKLKEIKQ